MFLLIYAQLANQGASDWFSTYLVRAKKRRAGRRGVTGLPLPPFHSRRDTARLVSKKVVKIEIAFEGPRPAES